MGQEHGEGGPREGKGEVETELPGRRLGGRPSRVVRETLGVLTPVAIVLGVHQTVLTDLTVDGLLPPGGEEFGRLPNPRPVLSPSCRLSLYLFSCVQVLVGSHLSNLVTPDLYPKTPVNR